MNRFYTLLFTLSFATVTTQAVAKPLHHTIKGGDSLFVIAQKNHTTVEQIRKANGMKATDKLKLGRVLTIPQKETTKTASLKKTKSKKVLAKTPQAKKTTLAKTVASTTGHKIQKGDSLFAIAQKNHTTVEQIRKVNGMKVTDKLKLGRVLTIPQNNKTVTVASILPQTKEKIKVAQVKKRTSHKKLVASLATQQTIALEKSKTNKEKSRTLGDILFGGNKDKNAQCEKTTSAKCVRITSLAKKKLGKRYVFGATGNSNTFDCSGLTTYVYKQNGIKLPRRAIAQSQVGKRINKADLKKGDLVFFDTSRSRRGYVNHVGIYIGDNKFIHASSAKHRVVISSLNEPFYRNRLAVARRLAS